MYITPQQQLLHDQALKLCRAYQKLEFEIVEVLQKIDRIQLYRKFGATSLYQYAIKELQLTEAVAYSFIAVARKGMVIPELQKALASRAIQVSKASRVVSVLTHDNAGRLIEFAQTKSKREVEMEVARLNPKAALKERVKPISDGLMELTLTVSIQTFKELERAQAVVAQKQGRHMNMADTLGPVLTDYNSRHDPVKKAERALARKAAKATTGNTKSISAKKLEQEFEQSAGQMLAKKSESFLSEAVETQLEKTARLVNAPGIVNAPRSASTETALSDRSPSQQQGPNIKLKASDSDKSLCPGRVTVKSKRKPRAAALDHEVFARDGGRCTYKDAAGNRCCNDRWLHVHHLAPVHLGGRDEIENLTTLCWSHHDLVHQLGFPIDGQVTWLREPTRPYRSNNPRPFDHHN